jgi:uncharacterized membrane protein YkvA (DUF1232 family)
MPTLITSSTPEHYSERSFWQKLSGFGRFAGYSVIEKALWLYYAAERPDTPRWAKTTVYGALAYFILPADAVADIIPIAGYTDDLAVLVVALTTISGYVDSEVKEKATAILGRWFPLEPDY